MAYGVFMESRGSAFAGTEMAVAYLPQLIAVSSEEPPVFKTVISCPAMHPIEQTWWPSKRCTFFPLRKLGSRIYDFWQNLVFRVDGGIQHANTNTVFQ